MTRTFARFLRAFDDDELVRFARDRAMARPPYWRALQLALRVEADRRGIGLDDMVADTALPRSHVRTTKESLVGFRRRGE